MVKLKRLLDYDFDYLKGKADFELAEKYFEIKEYDVAMKLYKKSLYHYFPTGARTNRTDSVLGNKEWMEQGDAEIVNAFIARKKEIENTAKVIEDRFRFLVNENIVEAYVGLADLIYVLAIREKYNELITQNNGVAYYQEGDVIEEAFRQNKYVEAANEVFKEKISLYEQAAAKNSIEALMFLGCFYKDRNLNKVAQEYFEKAVNLGCGSAAYAIAEMLDKDFYLIASSGFEHFELTEEEKQVVAEAVSWLLKAARLGHKLAMHVVVHCYRFGVAVEKDEKLAEWWSQIEEICNSALDEYKRTI